MKKKEEKILKIYWNERKFNLCYRYEDAPAQMEKDVYETFGFKKYVLAVYLKELKKIIIERIYEIIGALKERISKG